MFFPEGQVRVYLYGAPCDMRRSFNGLISLTKNAMGRDPLSGHLFVFVNRRGNYLKALYWDRFWVLHLGQAFGARDICLELEERPKCRDGLHSAKIDAGGSRKKEPKTALLMLILVA